MQRLRAPLAALIAFLIGGELAARGAEGPLDASSWLWRWCFPYFWLFLLLEAARARRALGDIEAFLLGAAAGLLYDGVYAKRIWDGALPLGVDWLGAAVAAFDWGLIAIVALHAADAVLPRDAEEEAVDAAGPAVLAALSTAAAIVYLLKTLTGRYRYERMLGSTWLLADLLLVAAAAALGWRALREDGEEPLERERWLWWLGALSVWLPGAQVLARLAAAWPGAGLALLVAVWSASMGWGLRRLWVKRGRARPERSRAVPAMLGLAAWRFLGATLIHSHYGPVGLDQRAAGAYQLLVELPTRAVFLYEFFSSRLSI